MEHPERIAEHPKASTHPLLCLLANLLRGMVRCAVPVAMLGVFAGLLYSDQGHDVLLVLVERAARESDTSLGGLVFLGVGSSALSLSLWYSMRWLLTAQMPALPLPADAGVLRRWAPRAVGAAAPALVAWFLYHLDTDTAGAAETARIAGHCFSALAITLLVIYWRRGWLIVRIRHLGWMQEPKGRTNGQPGVLSEAERLPDLTLRIMVWSTVLSLLFALLIMLFPLTLPRVIGAAGVAALALASINLFGSFVLTYWPLRNAIPLLAPWLLLYAGLIGSCNDNHIVQPSAHVDDAPVKRVPVAEDFRAFLERQDPGGKTTVPVLFVASEGGGIRAAYWTAAVLEALRRELPDMERKLYAMSGVSGGSVGVTAWLISRRPDLCAAPSTEAVPSATESLGMDFVSPAIAGMLYYDLMQRFLPWPVPSWDRSRALEEGWQRAFSHAPDSPFEHNIEQLYNDCDWLPHLLLNATVVETGQRAVLTRLETDPPGADRIFVNHFDAMNPRYTASRQTLAGLVHHSARFPVVSPAGTVQELSGTGEDPVPAFRMVDGGYFDNSGAQTVIELVNYLQNEVERPFKPILILVRNAADAGRTCDGPCTPGTSGVFSEVTSIVGALYNVRSAHAVSARESVAFDVVDLVVPADTPAARAPLGWSLSVSVKQALQVAAAEVAGPAADQLKDLYVTTTEAP